MACLAGQGVMVALSKLVYDDFAGYKAGFEKGMIEIGCMAHARRKFFDLHMANRSQLAEQALHSIGGLYEVPTQRASEIDQLLPHQWVSV
ncbi:hypothetical protein J2W53_003396 [Pseudomonas frederiksbergensis]|nr:hypothetical protein [Pseudomonas frederiksbergensis]